MISLPLELRTLIVDQLDEFEHVKQLSSCSIAWRDAAAPRLFRNIKLGSSHSRALIARMARFAPRHAQYVQRLALDLTYIDHCGHRGFVSFAHEAAHRSLAIALAAVARALRAVSEVAIVIHHRSTPHAGAYTPLCSALAALPRWRTLTLVGPQGLDLNAGSLLDHLFACAAGRVSNLTVCAPQSTASLPLILRYCPWIQLKQLLLTVWRAENCREEHSFDLTVHGVAVHIDCPPEDTQLFSGLPEFSSIRPTGALELAEASIRPMETM